MASFTQQGVVLRCDSLFGGQDFQGVITGTSEAGMDLYVPLSDVEIPTGTELEIKFWSKDGKSKYRLQTIVLRGKSASELNIRVEKPSALEQKFVRQYERAFVELPAKIAFEGSPKVHDAQLKDVSGGGVCIHTMAPLRQGDALRLSFALSAEIIGKNVGCTVVYCEQLDDGGFRACIKFTIIPPTLEGAIVAWVDKSPNKVPEKGW